jgi:hypothetical protein
MESGAMKIVPTFDHFLNDEDNFITFSENNWSNNDNIIDISFSTDNNLNLEPAYGELYDSFQFYPLDKPRNVPYASSTKSNDPDISICDNKTPGIDSPGSISNTSPISPRNICVESSMSQNKERESYENPKSKAGRFEVHMDSSMILQPPSSLPVTTEARIPNSLDLLLSAQSQLPITPETQSTSFCTHPDCARRTWKQSDKCK